jgi:hypothetical protein
MDEMRHRYDGRKGRRKSYHCRIKLVVASRFELPTRVAKLAPRTRLCWQTPCRSMLDRPGRSLGY